MRNEMKNSSTKIRENKEAIMKITTVVKASLLAATLGFACLLPATAHAQADAMASPGDYPFLAPETTAPRFLQPAAGKQSNADFEGKVSLPYGVTCGGKNLKPGAYLLSVKSDEGSIRVVTIHGGGENVVINVYEVQTNRGGNQSALMVRKSGEARSLEAIYVKVLNAMLYLDANTNGTSGVMDRLPMSKSVD
jgi:hypothetical protein